MTALRQTHTSSTKKSPRLSPKQPALDATQQALLDQLQSSREPWQTIGRYEPERPHEHPARRRAAGAEIAKRVPHAAHAEWTPPKNRPKPVDIVVAGNAGRQEELVPLRMGRMAASPFAFLRGAASVMAWDLSHTPVSGLQVMIDGDAHINNFGLYGTPQRDVVVDLNDFDEATVGPWEWDLKRLVASVNVAGRENGMSRKQRRRAVMRSVNGYRLNMTRLSKMGVLEVWSLYRVRRTPANRREGAEECLGDHSEDGGQGKADDERDAAAEGGPPQPATAGGGSRMTRQSSRAWTMTRAARSSPRWSSTPSISRRPTGTCCRRYAVADVAHRVVGVGSVGTRAYLVLLLWQR